MLTACPIFFSSSLAFLLVYPQSFIAHFFSNPVLRFYGSISYAFYLVHGYLAAIYNPLIGFVTPGSSIQLYGRMFAVLAVATAICALSYHFYERPIMKLRKRFISA